MNGLQMMLKAMGFDPVIFMKQIDEAKVSVQQTVQNFDTRLAALETRLSNIERLLSNQVAQPSIGGIGGAVSETIKGKLN
jgi:hypothetical protein